MNQNKYNHEKKNQENWEGKKSADVVSLSSGYIDMAAQFRDYTDFDYVDESILRTGALSHYKVLVIIKGEVMEPSDAKRIFDWSKKGGRVIVMDVPKFESVEGTRETEDILFGNKGSNDRILGRGRIVRVNDLDGPSAAFKNTMLELKLPTCDLIKDNVFATQIGKDSWLFLNTNDKESIINFVLPSGLYSAPVNQGTITKIDLNNLSK
ncbi:MAG TPA: hypothetical protein VFC36_05840 [Paludibacter sp.]|nr:hypothetical protein [Paludibacter sp.]